MGRRIIVLALIVCVLGGLVPQAQAATGDLLWYRHEGKTQRDYGRSICALPDGSLLVHGWFETYYEPDKPAVQLPPASGLRMIFLSKYSPDGQLQWLKVGGSAHCDEGGCISALPNGTCLMAGRFSYGGVAGRFGYYEPNATVLATHGGGEYVYDIVVAKYNPDGTLQWARCAGSRGADAAQDAEIAPDGACYVLGEFRGEGQLGENDGVDGNDVTLTPPEGVSSMSFLARYDTNGILQWAYGDDGLDGCAEATGDGACLVGKDGGITRVAADGGQSVVVPSADCMIMDIEAVTGDAFMVLAAVPDEFHYNYFLRLQKYSASGTKLWEKAIATPPAPVNFDLSVYKNGTSVVACGDTMYFVDGAGNSLGDASLGTGVDYTQIAAVDSDGAVAMTGGVWISTELGSGAGAAALEPRGSGDIMVAKYEGPQRWNVCGRVEGYGCITTDLNGTACFAGTTVTIVASPLFEGYLFDHWEGSLAGYTEPVVTLEVNSDLDFTAVFVPGPDAQDVPATGVVGLSLLGLALTAAARRRLKIL